VRPVGAEDAGQSSVLQIQQSVTTSQTGFPQFLYMYHVLDGAKSTAEAHALTGTISLENYSSNFSEVLWLLALMGWSALEAYGEFLNPLDFFITNRL
jgi:hypothetical protein